MVLEPLAAMRAIGKKRAMEWYRTAHSLTLVEIG